MALVGASAHHERVFPVRTQNVLEAVQTIMDELGIKKQMLAGVAVLGGVGSFMSSRISATVANGLAYALQIPAVALADNGAVGYAALSERFATVPPHAHITVQYSGQPNIRPPRTA